MSRDVLYGTTVHDDVDTPLPAGEYLICVEEGEQYRNAASGRTYSVRAISEDQTEIRYEYTRGRHAERVERTGSPTELGVIEPVGDGGGGVLNFWPADEPPTGGQP